jgi:hypothetical protein
MKILKIGLAIIILFIMSISAYFIYTRFFLSIYKMDGNILKFNGSTYICQDFSSASDEENLGKTIGIAVQGKRSIADYIWPFWVIEYNNDKEHNRIFIRGLMGSGGVYKKSLQ